MAQFFNKNLKHIRKIKNISQQELADKLNVDRSSISRWENEEMEATVDKAIQTAKILEVPFPEFLATDMTCLDIDAIYELGLGYSYNDVLYKQKIRDEQNKANIEEEINNGTYINDKDLEDFVLAGIIENKQELSEEQEKEILKNILKKKGFLNENEEMTEHDFNKLINFAKANKQFIMKDDK